MSRTERYLEILLWETLQNTGDVLGFMFAVQFLKANQWLPAILAMAVGAILTAALIAMTEAKKSPGHREPVQTMVANIFTMTAIGLLLAIVVGNSTWFVSFAIGASAGFALAVAQAVATMLPIRRPDTPRVQQSEAGSVLRHGVALGIGAGVVLALLNLLMMLQWPVWLNAPVALGIISPIIAYIDYPAEQKDAI